MSRYFVRTRVKFPDHEGGGMHANFTDVTPIGWRSQQGRRVEIFDAAGLEKARESPRWKPYIEAGSPADAFNVMPRKATEATHAARKPAAQVYPEVVRPFAPGQHSLILALDGLRTTVTSIMQRRQIIPIPQRSSTMGGAVLLENRAVSAARHWGSRGKRLGVNELIQQVGTGQPESHTQPVSSNIAKLIFVGSGDQRRGVALQLGGSELVDESQKAMDSLRNETAAQRLSNPGPLVILAVGNRAIPKEVQGLIARETAGSPVPNMLMKFDPSPAFDEAAAAAAASA